MYVAFLGTGSALPSRDRANTSLAIMAQEGHGVTLIDCGGDPYRALLLTNVPAQRLNDVIITHAHIDHIGGLPSLIESLRLGGRTQPLRIFLNSHALGVARELLHNFRFEVTLDNWPFAIEFVEIQDGVTYAVGEFTAMFIATEHTIPSMGMRLSPATSTLAATLAYTCDTRVAPMLAALGKDADLLIAEATYLRGMEEAARIVCHMTAEQAAGVATAAGAQALALVHLSTAYSDDGRVQREARAAFARTVLTPHDGEVYEIVRSRRTHLRRVPPRLALP